MDIATKFAEWDVPALESLKKQRIYILREKINNGYKLSIEERIFISKAVNDNSYFKDAVPLWGWKFDFSDVLKKFVVKQYGAWREYIAVDRTAIRGMVYGKIEKIIQEV